MHFSYTQITTLPTYYGLYASVVPIMCYAVFGSSKHVAVGPVALVCLLLSEVLGNFSAENDKVAAAILLSFFIGILCLIAGLLKLGFLTNILAKSGVTGFLTGLTIKVIFEQIPNITQITFSSAITVVRMYETIQNISEMNIAALVIAIISWVLLGMILFIKTRLKSKNIIFQLGSFIVITLITMIIYFFGFASTYGLHTVGTIPKGLVFPTWPNFSFFWDNISLLTQNIIIITVIGYTESVIRK